ncbi:MAG: DNA polymerase IV [Propionibacteriaceae bacterium]|jgi:DNA polymerase-4|nr:DNA polymerase IV [Propionibacteriaceae bacterium]
MAVIAHADLDAFYASVEARRRPELRHVPMWVGGGHRGVVLSANYLAREYGVRGGMPAQQAKRLCPHGVAVKPDMEAYSEASKAVRDVLGSITPFVEMASIDEAYLDISGCFKLYPDARAVGAQLRARIASEESLPCTVGIGPNRLVAKMASNTAKPDGLLVVEPEAVADFLHPMQVGQLHGIGPATAAKLNQLGIYTVGELAHVRPQTLKRAFGPKSGEQLLNLAWGRASARVAPAFGNRTPPPAGDGADAAKDGREMVSVGAQETFMVDTDDPKIISSEVLRVSSKVAHRMRQAQKLGTVCTLSLRFANFSELSRSRTLAGYTDDEGEIHREAMRIFASMKLDRPRIRRVGVRMSGLSDASNTYLQPVLDEAERGWREAERAVDKAIQRFGTGVMSRAALIR